MKKQTYLRSTKFVVVCLIMFCNLLNFQMQNGVAYPNQRAPIFMKTWGGSGNERGYRLWNDSDTIYTVGETDSYGVGGIDLVIIKWTLQGEIIWSTIWGTIGTDKGYSILGHGDYIYITGLTTGKGAGAEDLLLLKYDKEGTEIWNRTWGGSLFDEGDCLWGNSEYLYSIGSTFSFGEGNEDMALIQWDYDGNQIKNQTWGSSGDDWCADLWGNSESLYMTGYTSSYGEGGRDMLLLKFDLDCNYLWNTTWGDIGEDIAYGLWASGTDLYITGWTFSYDTYSLDAFIVKYNLDRVQIWNRTWGYYDNEYGYGISGDASNIYITGPIWSYTNGLNDVFVLRWDHDGNLLWETAWGGDQRDWGYDVCIFGSVVYCLGTTSTYGNGVYDLFFLAWNLNAPWFLDTPENIIDYEDYSDVILSWVVEDSNPSNYSLILDGMPVIIEVPWQNQIAIIYEIPLGLSAGNHNITIIVRNIMGEFAQDSVLFTILEGNDPYMDHSPIYIYGDSGFAEFPGLGTLLQPYLIENLRIKSDPYTYYTLLISDTTAHFIIRNCLIVDLNGNGIDLINIASNTGVIENNIIENCTTHGIFCIESVGVKIANNIIRNCVSNGLQLEICKNYKINGNFITKCAAGIIFASCDEFLVYNNTIEAVTREGIYQDGNLTKSYIHTNQIMDCELGGMVFIGALNNCTITDNIISNCSKLYTSGLHLENAQNCILANNIISDSSIHGIFCKNSDGVKIINNTIHNCELNGFQLEICKKFEINNNNITMCGGGLIFAMCDEFNVNYNTIDDIEWIGIYQDDNFTTSWINANSISNCENQGMSFNGILHNCNFTNNVVNQCANYGMSFFNGYNCTIIDNTIEYCSDGGLELVDTQNCTISSNLFCYNQYGIYLENSQNNLIYFNDIYGNWQYNAFESVDCIGNRWDNGSYGNYWGSIYESKYPNAISLSYICWNTPYEVNGLGDGIDNFPLIHSITVEFKEETITEPEIPFVHGFNSFIMVIGSISCIISIVYLTRKKQK